MRAGPWAPGECAAPRPASAPAARRRLEPVLSRYLPPPPPHTVRCQFGGGCCPRLRDLFSIIKSRKHSNLRALDLPLAGVVIPERAYLGASHPAGREPPMSNPS